MKLGMNTVIFGSVDLETALQHVEWAGFEYVELAAIAGMASEFPAAARTSGIGLRYSSDMGGRPRLSSPRPGMATSPLRTDRGRSRTGR